MKKLVMFTALIMVALYSADAQKIAASKVPSAVKAAFAKQYPGIPVKWENEAGRFEAGFRQNNNTMSTLYEANGTMVETEMDIKVTALSPSVLSYIKEHYRGKNIKEAAKITKADGTINYEAEVNGKDVIFDEQGKFLKEIKD